MRLVPSSASLLSVLASLCGVGGCSPPPLVGGGSGGGSGASVNGGNGGSGGSGTELVVTKDPPKVQNPCALPDAPAQCEVEAPPACGDGEINLDPPEACDDGNTLPGDGCTGACKVEPFHECPTPAQPCLSTILCGDGMAGPGEACDDGNTSSGDGCAGDCKKVEMGYRCRVQGVACVRVYLCGDGQTDPNEGCDDGDVEPKDGCDAKCRFEIGYKCEGSPSICTETVCGDKIVEGAESCDDGNETPFDGCTDRCQAEPTCVSGQPCSSTCGDGIVLAEDCDDGNLRDGDGCSMDCKVEPGFECAEDGPGACEMVNGSCTVRVPALFRDFTSDTVYSDFPGSTCNLTTGLVDDLLDANGKPVFVGKSCIKSQSTFSQWYTDNDFNRTMPGNIVLFADASGGYVNRLGDGGEQFVAPSTQATDTTVPCTTDDCLPCRYNKDQTCDKLVLDGNPMFFPLDGFKDAFADQRLPAKVPQQVYGADGWPLEDAWEYWPAGYTPTGAHNFLFSSEVQYWFRYDPADSATLEFVGDDDMWVFVNGHLAVDLGGVHTPEAGSVTLDQATGTSFGLQPGQVYPIKMFHAERKDPGSSFKLTLSGFTTGRSDCSTNCGDGDIGPGEECDDGPGRNLGGYNQCTPDCLLGPRCGDAVKQDEEVCDLGDAGNTGEYGGCSPTCQLGPHCGDGVKSDEEKCDDGENKGGYGACAPGCVLGPVCGDGGWEPEFEECDDANNLNKDGCSAACKFEVLVK